ncbi:hypothetical protein L596_030828 [Steinernema carpocapsae]|uniref:Uncharacterized protein n=1 Tax=Steinernema carpocapsae TaxID=34508 RepID=A0A4U5LN81_STECR|nr:hypothetical protein L596_030828 [Steinernema carpocapsae]
MKAISCTVPFGLLGWRRVIGAKHKTAWNSGDSIAGTPLCRRPPMTCLDIKRRCVQLRGSRNTSVCSCSFMTFPEANSASAVFVQLCCSLLGCGKHIAILMPMLF